MPEGASPIPGDVVITARSSLGPSLSGWTDVDGKDEWYFRRWTGHETTVPEGQFWTIRGKAHDD